MVWMRSSRSNSFRKPALILLVDDNWDGVLARQSVLEELGYQVVPAHSGSDALQVVEKQTFDLIITDYKMSPMDGLELISELRQRQFSSPIILLSGFAESIGLSPETTGADCVIQKSSNEISTLLRQTSRLLNPKKPVASSRPKAKARGAGAS